MNYSIIDTHCHITCDRLYDDVDNIIKRAIEHHVKKMLVICCTITDYERALTLQQKYSFIDIAFGFYPHQLDEFNDDDYLYLEKQIQDHKIIAVGEIGLDYHWDDVSKEDQMIGFHRQMKLADKYQIPVIIHTREATKDTLDVLAMYPNVKGIIHCFSGSIETARIAMKLGYYIAYGGPLTFKNARGAIEVCKEIPLDHMFVETDSPYLTPHPFRGKTNEPMYAEVTFKRICEIKEISLEEASKQMQLNYQKLFNSK